MLENITQNAEIPGLVTARVVRFGDDRGFFSAPWVFSEWEAALGRQFQPTQISLSKSCQGTIRGIHVEDQEKLIHVVTGEARVAYLDTRDLPSFGSVVVLDVKAGESVFVPRGVGNSFQVTSKEDLYYLYALTPEWYKGMPGNEVSVLDPELAIAWDSAYPLVLSERDQAALPLKERFPERYAKWKGSK